MFDAATTLAGLTAQASPPSVVLSGSQAGSGYLRILQQGTDLLEDRVAIDVTDPAAVTITTTTYGRANGASSIDGMAILPGTELAVVAATVDAKGTRLVDDGLTLAASTGSVHVSSWDTATLSGFTGGAVTVTLASGFSGSAHLTVVSAIDDLAFFQPFVTPASIWGDTIPRSGAVACMEPSSGGVSVTGETFDAVTATNADVSPALFANCYFVTPHALGPATLTVTLGAFQKTYATTVVADPPSGSSTGQAKTSAWKRPTSRGERAQAHAPTER